MKKYVQKKSNFRINKDFFMGSGGLLGPSWTLPDIFKNIKTEKYVRRKLLLRTSNDPPDTSQMIPNKFNKCQKCVQNLGSEPWT